MSKSGRILVSALLLAVVFSSLSFASSPDRITGSVTSANLVEIKGLITPLARPQDDVGPVDAAQTLTVTMTFTIAPAQQQALDKLVAEQQDRKSPNYHKWLTPAQYGSQFGLSPNDIAKISAWLQSEGLKITYVANGRDFLTFQGTASQIQSVFRMQIHNFNVKGKMHFANVTSPMIPAELNGIVGTMRGLHNFFPRSMAKQHPNYSVGASGGGFYTFLAPGDITKIYDMDTLISAGINGTGETIAIMGQSDVYIADINYFRGAFTLTPLSGCTLDSTQTIIKAGTCSTGNFEMVVPNDGFGDPNIQSGDLTESDLDIETVSGVARGAKILFVTSSGGVDDSAGWVIDQNLAKIISYSYGICEPLALPANIAAFEAEYEKGAGEGISFFAASGDAASAECDGDIGQYPAIYGPTVSYPASSAWVTAVGGTEFNDGVGTYWSSTQTDQYGTSALSYIPEIAWNDTVDAEAQQGQYAGSGGGASNCAFGTSTRLVSGYLYEVCTAPPLGGIPKPSYQRLNGITPNDSVRDVPDISFSGSNFNDPYIVCLPQSELGGSTTTSTCSPGGIAGINSALQNYNSAFGGTSASTPVAASIFAMLNQQLGSNGPVGLVNTQLYNLFSSSATEFNVVGSGPSNITNGVSNNIVACTPNTPIFEPTSLQCPASGQIGFTVAGTRTYNQVTGLGSLDVNAFFTAWGNTSTGSFTVSTSTANPASVSAGQSATSTVTITPASGFVSQVSFSCPGATTGITCSFNPSTVTPDGVDPITTTLTISTAPNMATGALSVPVSAAGGGQTQTSSVALTVNTTTESFTMGAQNASYQVTPGQSASVVVTIASTTGFVTGTAPNQTTAVPVSYSCSDPASESLCTVSPSTATTGTTVTFTITTTAPTGKMESPFHRSGIFYAALLPGLLGIVLTFSRKRSLGGMRMLGLIVMLGFSTMWLGSCGGSSSSTQSNPGTPANTNPGYTITFNASTGGAHPLTSTTTVILAVQ